MNILYIEILSVMLRVEPNRQKHFGHERENLKNNGIQGLTCDSEQTSNNKQNNIKANEIRSGNYFLTRTDLEWTRFI